MTQQKLIELNYQARKINEEIHQAKRSANKELRTEHKGLIRFLDFLLAFMILANIGALVLTNALVIKETPEKLDEVVELNPITADQYDYVSAVDVHPVNIVLSKILGYYFHFIGWTLMILIYLWVRFRSINRTNFYKGVTVFIFWGVALSLDFFNNLGIYLGKVFWG